MSTSVTDSDKSIPETEIRDEYRQLLGDYAAISRRRPGAAVATALRHQAPLYRDILAFDVTQHQYTCNELKAAIQAGDNLRSSIASFARFGDLGRLVLLQNIYEDDAEIGQRILRLAVDWLSVGKARPYRLLLVQFHILNGNARAAEKLLGEDPELDASSHYYLHTDVKNPFVSSESSDFTSWLRGFNAPFQRFNLLPITLREGPASPFSRLKGEVPLHRAPTVSQDKLVSVVFTSYQPRRADILNAVNSILEQTWKNLEIIVVDDGSGPEYRAVFDQLGSLDRRVKVVTTPQNAGTYKARNLGFGLAQGDYLTGHDDDDWSHPQRLEVQVSFLENNPDLAGCRVYSIACDVNLMSTRLGKKTPVESNASTLMLSRKTWKHVGGFLPVRKAADTELYLRVERITHKSVRDLPVPLTIIRKEEGSLSSAEFRAGWSHPARRSFKSTYNYWHQHSSPTELKVRYDVPSNLSIPFRFQIGSETEHIHFDVIFAGDWHPMGGPQRSMLEEIQALLAAGKRIGIMHLEPARFMSPKERPLNDTILNFINSGEVVNVLYDDPVSVDLLILRYPPIMQFPPAEPSAVRVGRTLIVANQAPAELDGTDIRYIPMQVHEHTKEAFGTEVLWVPQSPIIRDALAERLPSSFLAHFDLPGILDLDAWYKERRWFRSVLPVVGRHSRDTAMKWPNTASDLEAAYPIDGTFDVRFLGGADTALNLLKRSTVPGNWTVYAKDQISPERFLATLDFYIFFQHDNAVEAFGRSILEALASGMVVILDEKFRRIFGNAAVYTTPELVVDVVRSFHSDKTKYDQQVAKSLTYIQTHFSYESYQRRIRTLLEEINETTF